MRFAIRSFLVAALALPAAALGQPARPSPFDGQWAGVWSCGTSVGARSQNVSAGQPYSAKRGLVVQGGSMELKSGTPSQPGYREMTGQIASDGSVSLNGYGLSGVEGNRYRLWLTGRFQGDHFVGSGGEGDRSCILEMTREAPRPPLPGQTQTAQARPPQPSQPPQARPVQGRPVGGPVYDGLYRGVFECVGRRNARPGDRNAETVRLRREIVISQAQARYDFVGDRAQESAAGRIEPNGRIVLRGEASNAVGQRFDIEISGAVEGTRLTGDATIADRHCTVDLSRVGMPPPGPQQAFNVPGPPPSPREPQPQPAALSLHDGVYKGRLQCGISEAEQRGNLAGSGAYFEEREIVVQNGLARFVRGSQGQADSQYADGKVGADGRLIVEGRGTTPRMVSYVIRFDLDLRDGRASGSGKIGDRACSVQLSRDDAKILEARAPEPAKPAAPEPDGSKALLELALWDAVKGSSDPKVYQDYLKKYPNGHFAAVATSRVAEIQKAARAPAASAAPAIDVPAEILNEKRLALVIGNAEYRSLGKLANPVNDAKAMAEALRRLNFTVIERANVGREKMSDAIDEFGGKLRAGGVGLFFFAGHGMQIRGQNFLLPTDANPRSEVEVQGKAINAAYVLEHMAEARNRVNLVILDACRNNPLQMSMFRSASRGLAVVGQAPGGTIIAYATAPDAVAEDGDESNGLYTSELLKHLEVPGLKVEDVFKRVVSGVRVRSNGGQIPWTTGSLEGDFYFKLPGRRG